MQMTDKLVHVEYYSGYKAGERPMRVRLKERLVEVSAVEDCWYSPGYTYFRVLLATGERYVLRHQEAQDLWTIEAFRAASCFIDTKINHGV
jgi:hypothetical protein